MLQIKVNIGELDKKVTFIKKVIATNDFNEDGEVSWEVIDSNPTVWAKVTQRQGKEVTIADRIAYVQTTIFTIRYRDDITELNRVVYKGRPYDIRSIIENNNSREGFLDVIGEIVDNETWT